MDDQHLLVVGDGEVAEALVSMARLLGWRTTPAPTLPDVTAALPSATAVVVTTHDADVDAPALAAALGADLAYIGAMGSRRTQARRRDWLLAHGVTEDRLDAVHGPAGLDIGANTPAEIALSILAELVGAVREVDAGGSISGREGPVHVVRPEGGTYSPTD